MSDPYLRLRLEIDVAIPRTIFEEDTGMERYMTNEEERSCITRLRQSGYYLEENGMLTPDEFDLCPAPKIEVRVVIRDN